MSTTGIIGTLTITLTEGESSYEIASLLNASLDAGTAMKPALHPNQYGWDYFVPGTQTWRADAAELQLQDTDTGNRPAYLLKLELFWLNKTLVDIAFESPTGAMYYSEGYIDKYQLGGGEQGVYGGSFGIQGVTELLLSIPPPDATLEVFRIIPYDVVEDLGSGDTMTDNYIEQAGLHTVNVEETPAWHPSHFEFDNDSGLRIDHVDVGEIIAPYAFVTQFLLTGSDTQDVPYLTGGTQQDGIYTADTDGDYEIKSMHDDSLLKAGVAYNTRVDVIVVVDDVEDETRIYIDGVLVKTWPGVSEDGFGPWRCGGGDALGGGLLGKSWGFVMVDGDTPANLKVKCEEWIAFWDLLGG